MQLKIGICGYAECGTHKKANGTEESSYYRKLADWLGAIIYIAQTRTSVVGPLLELPRFQGTIIPGSGNPRPSQYRAAGVTEAPELRSLWSAPLIAPQKRACIASATDGRATSPAGHALDDHDVTEDLKSRSRLEGPRKS